MTTIERAVPEATPKTARPWGLCSALVNTFHELGGAVGVSVLSSVAGSALTAARPSADAFQHAFIAGAVAAAASAVAAAAVLPRTFRHPADGRLAH
ncbi:hypothetical protein [Pseudofrankia sp. BMG5.36]|uniref:hypothetical protein n=1 Tax=Pseudofrankia sp. BMG5.36 TaxID=1834512 RepID=UPI0008D8DE3D|nr:hypothetical protein [Pseudofrankia sp. BMG5.36]